jgi:hypothetical protein
MTKERTNFLGIPIEGDIDNGYSRRKVQRPREEFEPFVKAVLDEPFIVAFGWRQYTPYFNDGDPCIFGATEVWARTEPTDGSAVDEDEDEDSERWDVDFEHPTLGHLNYSWNNHERICDGYEGPEGGEERLRKCLALSSVVQGGEFDDVLLELFGDHAQVTVTRTGITVDTYEHD